MKNLPKMALAITSEFYILLFREPKDIYARSHSQENPISGLFWGHDGQCSSIDIKVETVLMFLNSRN